MKKIFLSCLILLLLTSCAENPVDRHVTTVGNMRGLTIVDLRSALVNNLLVAQGTFHNTGSKVQTGFYRCQFYDANQMQVGDPQIWQPMTIYANEDQAVKCKATQIEATRFKIEFSADGKNVSMKTL
jgi:uncharacterized protein YcfL